MSHRNKVIALGTALGLLLVIYAAGMVFAPGGAPSRGGSVRLLAAKPVDVASLSIAETQGGGMELSFTKSEKGWTLLEGGAILPVQAGRVTAFLDSVAAVGPVSLRSRGGAGGSAGDYGLSATQARRVVARDAKGAILADFTVGGMGLTGKECYVRLGEAQAVYVAEGSFQSYAVGPRSSWLDLRLFPSPATVEEVQSISVESLFPTDEAGKAQKPYAWKASRKDKGWTGARGEYDSVAVEGVIRSVNDLSAVDIASSVPKDAFARILGRVSLELGQGRSLAIEVGAPAGEQRYFARVEGAGQVYVVGSYAIGAVFRAEPSMAAKR